MKAQTCKTNPRARFSIKDKPNLTASFLIKLPLTADMSEIRLADGRAWKLYAEAELAFYWKNYLLDLPVGCICSFQEFSDGERICVARLWKSTAIQVNDTTKESSRV